MSLTAHTLPRLRYFAFPGRCYAARVALFNSLGKAGWIDERIGMIAFRKLKATALKRRQALGTGAGADAANNEQDPILTSNNLPQLLLPAEYIRPMSSASSTVLTQSHAIARFAARMPVLPGSTHCPIYTLYPQQSSLQDLYEAALIDEAMALVDSVVGLAPKDEDKELRLQKRAAYIEDFTGPLWLALNLLEERLGKKDFLVGEGSGSLSLADLYLKKPLTDMILEQQFEGVSPEWVRRKFPALIDHSARVQEHALIQEYLTHYRN